MNAKNSVVVLGAGISGLTASAFLAKQGWEVQVHEANSKVGGCSANTTQAGFTFHDGAVFLVLPQVLRRVFERLNLDFDESLKLRRATCNSTTYLPDGAMVTLHDGSAVSIAGRSGEGERASEELARFIQSWSPIYRALTGELMERPPSTAAMLKLLWRHLPRLMRPASLELSRAVSSAAVQSALAGSILYSGVPAKNIPALGLLGLVAALTDGTWLPEGGMGQIPIELRNGLLKNGGEIALNSPCEKIVIKNGRVVGVNIRGQGFVEATTVLSTLSSISTFGKLLESSEIPGGIKRKIRTAKLSQRAVSIQLGLRNRLDTQSYGMNLLPYIQDQDQYFRSNDTPSPWLAWTVPTSISPSLAPEGGSIIEVFPPIRQDLLPQTWDDPRKKIVLDQTLETLSKYHRLDIAVTRVRGPAEFEREMHLPDGTLYGLSTSTNTLAMFPHRTPIEGLFLAGQTTFPGYSVPAAASGGLLAAEAIINRC